MTIWGGGQGTPSQTLTGLLTALHFCRHSDDLHERGRGERRRDAVGGADGPDDERRLQPGLQDRPRGQPRRTTLHVQLHWRLDKRTQLHQSVTFPSSQRLAVPSRVQDALFYPKIEHQKKCCVLNMSAELLCLNLCAQ